MTHFVKLTGAYRGTPMWFNPEHVRRVWQNLGSMPMGSIVEKPTCIQVGDSNEDDDNISMVAESPEEVVRMLTSE